MKAKYIGLALPFIFSLLFLIACSPGPEKIPQAKPVSQQEVPQAKPSWQNEWDRTLKLAVKEGKVTIVSGVAGEFATRLRKEFTDKNGIDMEFIAGRSADVARKVITEHKAGINLVDIVMLGPSTTINMIKPYSILEPLRPYLFLPEVLDDKAWWDGKLPFVDRERSLVFQHGMMISQTLTYNTDLVKPEDLQGMKDLLSPRWKGKIIMDDPTIPGSGARIFGVVGSQFFGFDYWREFAKQEPMIVRDQRFQIESLVHGKYGISIGTYPESYQEFKRAGAPINRKVPVDTGYIATPPTGSISLINNTPHPNAAKIFVNWFLSKDGQYKWSQFSGNQSWRFDVPTDHLDKNGLRDPNQKYFNTNEEDYVLKEPEFFNVAKDIFGPMLGR